MTAASDNAEKVDMSSLEKGTDNRSKTSLQSSPLGATEEVTSDVLGREKTNPVARNKIHLVNNAIDEIGWTPFHTKLFCLSGFGYAVDSLIAMLAGITAGQAYAEIGDGGYPTALAMSLYAGLFVGALFWGLGADLVGRKIAFNITLFIVSLSSIVAGSAPNWPTLGFFVSLIGFGAGGNLVLDPTVFLEYLPSKYQWLITCMAFWWGIGQAAAGFIAWGFFSRSEWSCSPADPASCTWQNNKAWRLIFFTSGALVFVMSLLRVFVIRLKETPKYMLASGKEEQLVADLRALAEKYNRSCSLRYEHLVACGSGDDDHSSRGLGAAISQVGKHLKGLFATRRIGLSTVLVWFSWTLIGLAYPLFFIFLPSLIANRVPNVTSSFTDTWRDYTITNLCACIGPLIACVLCEVPLLGRRYTMSIGAIVTAIFFFGYTVIRTSAQNLALSSSISVCINIYYGTLYAYTAEVLPSAHRTTGNGIAVGCNRIMGLLSAVIAQVGDTTTTTPLYICAAMFIIMSIVSAALPFEPRGSRAS
ncbi:hypothetical protein ACHAQA_008697 [Verticillium albo-atrum]